ncbi:MAG: hypothetical protein MUF34_00405 [Polyangiaceae bacterium]|jgi:hypothetical protein|nr:hypothetical protein [Polyangiaceae bacterium]
MRSSKRARLLAGWLFVSTAFVACNSLTGADKLETLPAGASQGAAGDGTAGSGAGGDGTSGDGTGGGGTSGSGTSGGGVGPNDDCDEAPNCSQCCLNQVTNAMFAVAVSSFFDVCFCEPARDRDGGSGNGKCENVVSGCEQCCTRLCDEGEPSAIDLADCARCAARQGGEKCDNPRDFCQLNFGDSACSQYFDCEVQYECRNND